MDVKRSPGVGKGIAEESLVNVLRAYALYEEKVGYCQGMSFMAEFILSFAKDEAISFSILAGVIDRLSLGKIYGENMNLLIKEFYRLDKLLGICLPRLQEYLRIMNVTPGLYSTSWFITLFTATMDEESKSNEVNKFLVAAWDHFIALGWKGVYKAVIFLLGKLGERVEELETSSVLQLLMYLGKEKFWAEEEFAAEFREKVKKLKITNVMLEVLSQEYDDLLK